MNTVFTLIRFILLYLIMIMGTTFTSYITKKKFEKAVAPYFCIVILILYIFGLFEGLLYGVWIISILSILLGVYAIVKDKKIIKDKIMTPGFTFFSLAFLVLIATSFRKSLVDYDHYLYRSINEKVMYYNNTMGKGFIRIYQPAVNLIGYFFMKVIGGYIHGVEAVSMQMFGFSMLIPLFDRKEKNRFLDGIIAIVLICIPAIFHNLVFYESAYPDPLLGIMLGYVMYTLYKEENNILKVLFVGLTLSVLTITKPIGIYLSFIIIGMYLLISILNNKERKSIKAFVKSKEFKNICIFIVLVIAISQSWKIYTKVCTGQFNKPAETQQTQQTTQTKKDSKYVKILKTALTTVFGYYDGDEHLESDTNEKLISKIYGTYATNGIVRLTLYGATMAILISAVISYKYVIKKENKKEFARNIIALFIGLLLYILLLEVSYITVFSKTEMIDHAGMDRYMPPFLFGILFFIIANVIDSLEGKKSPRINYIILIVLIISCTNLQSILDVTVTSGIYNIQSIEYTNIGRIRAGRISEELEEKDEVMLINQDEKTDLFNLMIRYYLYPEHMSYVYNRINDDQVVKVQKEIIQKNIKYLYVYKKDECVDKIKDNDIEIEEDTLYKVNITEDKNIELEKVKNIIL